MIDIIVGMTAGLCLFLCTYKAYNKGLEHGKLLSNGIVPKVNLNPIAPIKQAIETHKVNEEQKKLEDDLTDIMGATKESMLDAIKKAR